MNTLNPFNGCLKFNCLYCGQHIECAPRLAGRQLLCPTCQHRIVIPPPNGGSQIRRALSDVFTWDDNVPLPNLELSTRHHGALV